VQAYAYVGEVDYFSEQDKLEEIYNNIENNEFIVGGSTRSWYQAFLKWSQTAASPGQLTNGTFYSNYY